MKHQRGLTALVLFVWLSITGFGSRYSTSPDPSSLGGEGVLFALSRKKEPKTAFMPPTKKEPPSKFRDGGSYSRSPSLGFLASSKERSDSGT